MNVLISGIAGDIGFGAARILRDWGWKGLLHGVDVQSDHAGEFIFDQQDIAPHANDPTYLDWLESYIDRNSIGFFLPTSEAEIVFLVKAGIKKIADAHILIANRLAVEQSLDKFACLNFLSNLGIRVPENGIVGITAPTKYPVITKPRTGQGSKQIQKIEDFWSFQEAAIQGHVWQEYLAPDEQEYTCPVYSSVARGTRILVCRRTLTGGLTGRGEVVSNSLIEKYVADISSKLELDGPINVQLRLTATGPCLFEINPRLSSTLVFRDKMGFSDLRWWIQDTLGIPHTPPIQPYSAPDAGTRFYRGSQEYISSRLKN